jgi:hypothetical protein
VVIEREVERIGDFPLDVEAERLVLVARRELHAAHREVGVRGRDVLRVDQRPGDRSVGPRTRARRVVEPDREFVALLLHLVLGVGVVERRRDAIGRRELHHQLPIGALALHAVDAQAEVLRTAVDVVAGRTVRDQIEAGLTGLRQPVPAVGVAAAEHRPAIRDRGLAVARVALLVARGEADTEATVGKGVAQDARHLRRHRTARVVVGQVVGRRVEHALDPDVREEAGILQRPRGLDVDRRADAAGRGFGARGLVDLDRGHRLGGEVGEIEGARVARAAAAVAEIRRRHLAAVEQDEVEVRTDATHGHAPTFAARGAIDRHAADTLQGFGQIGVGELADVLGDDAVDHTLAVALHVHRRLQAADDAGDDDLVERFGFFAIGVAGLVLGLGGGLREARRRQREQQRRRQDADLRRLGIKFHRPSLPRGLGLVSPARSERTGRAGIGPWRLEGILTALSTDRSRTAISHHNRRFYRDFPAAPQQMTARASVPVDAGGRG